MHHNVFIRRSRAPRGSNHDTSFLWLAFEAVDPSEVRDHSDKIAVRQARTLAHGDAIDVARYLRSRSLPVPSILSDAASYLQAERLRGQCPSDTTAPRSGIGAIAYAVALSAYGTVHGRSTTAYQATGRYAHQIALGRNDWRLIDPDESSRWNDWRQIGGESVCTLEDYSREHMRQWQIGKIKPLPVYAYARKPSDMLTVRAGGCVAAVVLTAEPAKIVGFLTRSGSPTKRVARLDTAKLHANVAKGIERAKAAERAARVKAVKLASKAGQSLDKIEARRAAEYDRAFKLLGVVVTRRCTGASWGRKSYAWDLKIGPHIEVRSAWWDGEPDNREIMRRVTRYLAMGY